MPITQAEHRKMVEGMRKLYSNLVQRKCTKEFAWASAVWIGRRHYACILFKNFANEVTKK